MKKLISILVAIALMIGVSPAAYASANGEIRIIDESVIHNGYSLDPQNYINTVAINNNARYEYKPTVTTPWVNNIIYYDGSAGPFFTVYSNGFFTNASEVKFTLSNTGVGSITIYLWEETAAIFFTASRTINGGDTLTFTIAGLDRNKKYYLASAGPTVLKGTALRIS